MEKKLVKSNLILFFLLLNTNVLWAEDNFQRIVSLNIKEGTLVEVLNQINGLEGIQLSYDPSILEGENVVAKHYVDIPISEIIGELLGDQYNVLYMDDYAVIKVKPQVEKPIASISSLLETVALVEEGNSSTTNTDSLVDADFAPDSSEFKPVLDSLYEQTESTNDESVKEIDKSDLSEEEVKTESDSIPQHKESNLRTEDLPGNEFEHKTAQASVVRGLGSSGENYKKITIDFSANLFDGVHSGVNAFELGLFFNNQLRYTHGIQIAGIGNKVGEEVRGLQVAGLLNLNNGSLVGWQVAGVGNITQQSVKGAQTSLLANYGGGDVSGAQLALGANISKGDFLGLQSSLVGNYTKYNFRGIQSTLGLNYVGDTLKGLQASLGANIAKDVRGFQVAMLSNSAQSVEGGQVALFNRAKRLKGIQIGVINVVDSLEKGVTIGAVNLVKNGKVELGLEYNDAEHLRLAFRTGTNAFYNIYSAGISFLPTNELNEDHFLWTYGFGFGSQVNFGTLFANLELTSTMVNNTERDNLSVNLLNRLHLNLGLVPADWVNISGGPVLNVLVTEDYDPVTETSYDFADKRSFYSRDAHDILIKMWVGYSVAINF